MIVDDLAAKDEHVRQLVSGSTIIKVPFQATRRIVIDNADGSWDEMHYLSEGFTKYMPPSHEWCRPTLSRVVIVGTGGPGGESEVGFVLFDSSDKAVADDVMQSMAPLPSGTYQNQLESGGEPYSACRATAIMSGVGGGIVSFSTMFVLGSKATAYPRGLAKHFTGMVEISTADRYDPCFLLSSLAVTVFSLLNCKNVTTVPVEPPSFAQQTRARRGKLPLYRHHTLAITVPGAQHERAAAKGAGEPLALHWKRGHFKEYKDRGLFGKHRGLYWWSPHLAGRADRIVTKDYEVRA